MNYEPLMMFMSVKHLETLLHTHVARVLVRLVAGYG